MTPTEDALLAAIRTAPDVDLPRLVYADWLDEHDQPERAEFIRVQCELVRLPESTPHRAALEFRERQLLAIHAREWASPFPGYNGLEYAGDDELHAVFRRGFVERTNWMPADMSAGIQFVTSVFGVPPIGSRNSPR